MEEEVKYTSEFDGQTTDEVLEHAKSVKDLTIPSLSEISGFVCINKEGNAIGMMSKEQVAQVVETVFASTNIGIQKFYYGVPEVYIRVYWYTNGWTKWKKITLLDID